MDEFLVLKFDLQRKEWIVESVSGGRSILTVDEAEKLASKLILDGDEIKIVQALGIELKVEVILNG